MFLGPWTSPHPALFLNITLDDMTELQIQEWFLSPGLLSTKFTQDELTELKPLNCSQALDF
jgi:hypothetical protein